MSKEKVKVSSSMQYRVQAYSNAKYKSMIEAYTSVHDVSESSVVNKALRQFFDTMPNEIKIKYMGTPNAKKNNNSF